MEASKQNELLELYKLHAELADRVSQRREGANRLYVSLLVGLVIFAAALFRFGTDGVSADIVLICTGALGMLLSASWYIVIRSYRQLNSGKFLALQDLESRLAYPFFTKEWEFLGQGKDRGKYWKLTVVETGLPVIFFVLSICLVVFSYLGLISGEFNAY